MARAIAADRQGESAESLDDDDVSLLKLFVVHVRPSSAGAPKRALEQHPSAALTPAPHNTKLADEALSARSDPPSARRRALAQNQGEC
jgi:hypothetical protein